jgi:hypothetical protein
MIQCVICNKFSLFAPRLKALEKQKKNKYPCWRIFLNEKNLNVLEVNGINSFLYKFKAWTKIAKEFEWMLNLIGLNSTFKIKFKYIEWNLNWIKVNSISVQLKTNEMQIGGKNIQYYPSSWFLLPY